MAKLNAKQVTEKHNRRLKQALDDMQNGINAVTESPTKKAAAKQDKMRQNIINAIDSGKWAAGLNRVTVDQWKDAMINKGIGRVAAGVDGSADKIEAFFNELLPHIDTGVNAIKKLPDVSLEDNIQRATTFMRHMAKFKRKQ